MWLTLVSPSLRVDSIDDDENELETVWEESELRESSKVCAVSLVWDLEDLGSNEVYDEEDADELLSIGSLLLMTLFSSSTSTA